VFDEGSGGTEPFGSRGGLEGFQHEGDPSLTSECEGRV
jgi:hypothetical protein